MRAVVTRVEEHHFHFSVRGMEGDLDVPREGEKSVAPNPKEMTLAALCGCTGTDVVDLLNKFKITYASFVLEARAGLTEPHPKVFDQIDLQYTLTGVQGDLSKVVEAVKRSTHQYSGMAAMLSRVCPIRYKVHVDGMLLAEDQAQFAAPKEGPTT